MRRFRRWVDDHLPLVALGFVFIVLIALAFLERCNQRSCEARGGRVEHYNHRTIMITQSCGNGCWMTVPVETSDWRCVE